MRQQQLRIVIDRCTEPTHPRMEVVRAKLSVQAGQTVRVGRVVVGLVRGIGLNKRGEDTHGAVMIVGKLDDAGHLGEVDVGSRVDLPPACLLYTSDAADE